MTTEADATAPEAGSGEGEAVSNAPEIISTDTEAPDLEAEAPAEGEGAEVEEVEFDFGGNKFRAPKGAIPEDIAQELDKFTKGTWSDYTRKSQEVAEARRAVEAEKSVVQKLSSLKGDTLTTFTAGLHLRQEIEQLSAINLDQLWQSNPDQARRVSDMLSAKQAAFQRTVAKVNELEQTADREEQARTARLVEEGRAKIQKAVKGFDEAKLTEYAIKHGYTAEQVKSWPTDPIGTQMAWKAMQYDALQAKATNAAKPTTPPAEPVQSVKGKNAPATIDPDRMTDDQWVKWRNAQREKAGRR